MNARTCEECLERLPDLLEGSLDEGAAEPLRAHLAECPACRAEHAWLAGLTADLESLGEAWARSAPSVDLVAGVLAAAEAADRRAEVEAAARRRQARSRRWAVGLSGAAMAAAAAFVIWIGRDQLRPTDAGGPVPGPPRVAQDTPPAAPPSAVRDRLRQASDLLAMETAPLTRQRPPAPDRIESTPPPDVRNVTFDEVVRMRQRAITDENARADLVRWATFTTDEARKILQKNNLSVPALVGLAESLDEQEASQALMTAIGHYPEDPYLRFALASKAVSESPVPSVNPLAPAPASPETPPTAETQQWLDAWQALDPNNALSYYLEAQMHLQNGDLEGALELLRQAQELEYADPYTLEAALAREQALIAGGMPPDAARLLSALTAGNNEYNFLYALGDDLLEFGRTYAEQNYLPEAQQIFEAVNRLGEQVQNGADFALVESAGLSIQQQALMSLERIYAALASEDAAEQFRRETQELLDQAQELNRYLDELNALFASSNLLWSYVADAILEGGDLNLLDYLYQGP